MKQEDHGIDKTGQLYLTFPWFRIHHTQQFYIIDEVSMISDVKDPSAVQAVFGREITLDLLEYNVNAKFI